MTTREGKALVGQLPLIQAFVQILVGQTLTKSYHYYHCFFGSSIRTEILFLTFENRDQLEGDCRLDYDCI